jgi:hypothetical protein
VSAEFQSGKDMEKRRANSRAKGAHGNEGTVAVCHDSCAVTRVDACNMMRDKWYGTTANR